MRTRRIWWDERRDRGGQGDSFEGDHAVLFKGAVLMYRIADARSGESTAAIRKSADGTSAVDQPFRSRRSMSGNAHTQAWCGIDMCHVDSLDVWFPAHVSCLGHRQVQSRSRRKR
jgi:hypothetical protein